MFCFNKTLTISAIVVALTVAVVSGENYSSALTGDSTYESKRLLRLEARQSIEHGEAEEDCGPLAMAEEECGSLDMAEDECGSLNVATEENTGATQPNIGGTPTQAPSTTGNNGNTPNTNSWSNGGAPSGNTWNNGDATTQNIDFSSFQQASDPAGTVVPK